MKILLISQNFYPENFKSNDIAFELVKYGYKVDVLTGIPNYPEGKYSKGYGIFSKRFEKINNVRIIRAFQISRGGKNSKLRLSLNYLSFTVSATIYAFFLSISNKYSCVIVHQTSPITQVIPGILVKKIQRIKLLTWVLDIWPDSVILGGGVKNKSFLLLIDKLVKYVYSNSDIILISSKQFEDLILQKGNHKEKIVYFPNWCVDIKRLPMVDTPKLPEGFIIMMAGNIGTAQNIDVVLNAALLMKDNYDVKWIFLGEGSKKSYLDNFIKIHQLEKTVIAMGLFPFSAMPAFFNQADILLLSLKADFPHLKAVVPARLQSYMSAERPVIAMVENGSGSAEIIKESNCGISVPPDDYKLLVDVIKYQILINKSKFEQLGINGRKYFEKNFTLEICMKNLIDLINKNCSK